MYYVCKKEPVSRSALRFACEQVKADKRGHLICMENMNIGCEHWRSRAQEGQCGSALFCKSVAPAMPYLHIHGAKQVVYESSVPYDDTEGRCLRIVLGPQDQVQCCLAPTDVLLMDCACLPQ